MIAGKIAIVPEMNSLSYREASRIFEHVVRCTSARTVIIDLKRVRDATTSGFARLVLLRRTLLRAGRDLRLAGLHDRVACLYGINRLAGVLPCA